MKDPDKIERVLMAAASCDPVDDREAAIIGAIAATVIDLGHFRPAAIAAHAADAMAWAFTVARDIDKSIIRHGFAGPGLAPLCDRMFPSESRKYPTSSEVRRASEKFMKHYNPPTEGVAA